MKTKNKKTQQYIAHSCSPPRFLWIYSFYPSTYSHSLVQENKQFKDTNCMSYNSTQCWHYLPGYSIISHRLRKAFGGSRDWGLPIFYLLCYISLFCFLMKRINSHSHINWFPSSGTSRTWSSSLKEKRIGFASIVWQFFKGLYTVQKRHIASVNCTTNKSTFIANYHFLFVLLFAKWQWKLKHRCSLTSVLIYW